MSDVTEASLAVLALDVNWAETPWAEKPLDATRVAMAERRPCEALVVPWFEDASMGAKRDVVAIQFASLVESKCRIVDEEIRKPVLRWSCSHDSSDPRVD